jgi:hypothetical protein
MRNTMIPGRVRVSLRTLILLALFAGSCGMLAINWSDWKRDARIGPWFGEDDEAVFSDDNSCLYFFEVSVPNEKTFIQIFDSASGKAKTSVEGGWSMSAGRTDSVQVFDRAGVTLASRTRREEIDARTIDRIVRNFDSSETKNRMKAVLAKDGRKLFLRSPELELWSRRRSNEWWGAARLWESWLAFALLAVLAWSVFSDRRAFRRD